MIEIVDQGAANSIDMDKLVAFHNSKSARNKFRDFAHNLRAELDKSGDEITKPQIPFMLSTMFDLFCNCNYQK